MTDSPDEPLTVSETLRAGGWSLRSALVRYAQFAPEAASAVLSLARRLDGALEDESGRDPSDTSDPLGRARHELASLADALAAWADSGGEPPEEVLRQSGTSIARLLSEAGVAAETPRGGPPGRGR